MRSLAILIIALATLPAIAQIDPIPVSLNVQTIVAYNITGVPIRFPTTASGMKAEALSNVSIRNAGNVPINVSFFSDRYWCNSTVGTCFLVNESTVYKYVYRVACVGRLYDLCVNESSGVVTCWRVCPSAARWEHPLDPTTNTLYCVCYYDEDYVEIPTYYDSATGMFRLSDVPRKLTENGMLYPNYTTFVNITFIQVAVPKGIPNANYTTTFYFNITQA